MGDSIRLTLDKKAYEIAVANLTVFYVNYDSLLFEFVKDMLGCTIFDIPLSHDTVKENLNQLTDEQMERVFVAVEAILGVRVDYDRKFFYENRKMGTQQREGRDISWLSTGTISCIGVMTLVLNPQVFCDGTMLIRHPDFNLHPKSQSSMGKVVSSLKMTNPLKTKLMLHTHSEHFINGMRVNILEKKLDLSNLVVNFFDSDAVYTLGIDSNNKVNFETWPEGFMDEHMNAMSKLFNMRTEKI